MIVVIDICNRQSVGPRTTFFTAYARVTNTDGAQGDIATILERELIIDIRARGHGDVAAPWTRWANRNLFL